MDTSTPIVFSHSGAPLRSGETELGFGSTTQKLSFSTRATDSVFVNEALVAATTVVMDTAKYDITISVPAVVRLKVVETTGNVLLETIKYSVSSDIKTDSTSPTIVFASPDKDQVLTNSVSSLRVVVAPVSASGVDSVTIAGGAVIVAMPWQADVAVHPGENTLVAVVHASNGKTARASLRITVPSGSGDVTRPQALLLTPASRKISVAWGQKQATLTWKIWDSAGIGEVAVDGVSAVDAPIDSQWTFKPQLKVGTQLFKLAAKDPSGNTTFDSVEVTRSPDTTHPLLMWQGNGKVAAVGFGTKSFRAVWMIADSDTVVSAKVDGIATTPSGSFFAWDLGLRKSSKGYDTTFHLVVLDRFSNRSEDSIVVHVLPDTTHPVVVRGAGTGPVVLRAGTLVDTLEWVVTDFDSVASVVVNGRTVHPKSGVYAAALDWSNSDSMIPVKLVATDAAGNSTTDSFVLRVSKAPPPLVPTISRNAPFSATVKSITVPWETKTINLSWSVAFVGSVVCRLNGSATTSSPSSGGIWSSLQVLSSGSTNRFVLVAIDSSNDSVADTVYVTRKSDTTQPEILRGSGATDTTLLISEPSFTPSWTISDNALKSVTIDGATVTGDLGAYSRQIVLPSGVDSLWVVVVATDSSLNTSRDSIKVYRLSAPVLSPPGGGKYQAGAAAVNVTARPSINGAELWYSTNDTDWIRYPSSGLLFGSSQIFYARASWMGRTSPTSSATFLWAPAMTSNQNPITRAPIVTLSEPGTVIEDSISYRSEWSTYNKPIELKASARVFARSRLNGHVSSNSVGVFAMRPELTRIDGVFSDSVWVSAMDAGADSIQWTTDTSSQWTTGADYLVRQSGTIYARSVIGNRSSEVATATFTVRHDTSLASISVGGKSLTVADEMSSDSLPAASTRVVISAIPTSAAATVTYNGSATGVIPLTGATTPVVIEVKNGTSRHRYDLSILRRPTRTFTDSRDGQVYAYTMLAGKKWMAQNLNFRDTGIGLCYNNSTDSCAKYGRLYTWGETMGLDRIYDSVQYPGILALRGICPEGWRVPTFDEWQITTRAVVGSPSGYTYAAKLMGTSSAWGINSGTDDFDFNAIPSGYYYPKASDFQLAGSTDVNGGSSAFYWTANQTLASPNYSGIYYVLQGKQQYLNYGTTSYVMYFSVRCTAD
ncbi:MAG: hypothetical protein RL173_1296 [Fibrobacterota bacterium]